jgi:hypothetical protein
MSTFAEELASRMIEHEPYWLAYQRLQSAGAGSTLPPRLERTHSDIPENELAKLLYCASVFAQTSIDSFQTMAQSIALNALLVDNQAETRERCAHILTELGNFPSLSYVEKHYPAESESLRGMLQRGISKELNGVQVGGVRLHLTDYQKELWRILPSAKSLAVSAPTSAGKSFLVIEYMCRVVSASAKFAVVYVAPTRALLSEVHQTVKRRLNGVSGLRVSTVPSLDAEPPPRQVFVLTQERLQVLLAISDIKFDLIVVDEAQNISDGSRGMLLQDCLEHVIERNPNLRIVMLAPGAEGFVEAGRTMGITDLTPLSTNISPVLQNRILVSKVAGRNALQLRLLSPRGAQPIGVLSASRGFDHPAIRLASVALELGSTGGSLIYATGPSDAETVAMQLCQELEPSSDSRITDLAAFVEQHIHREYKLAALIRKGVAFHYGRMPTLLREALEEGFKCGSIRFLTCTTTLFQGVNLPARNVFIDTPLRGRGAALDPALLWNFAGRAGRMRKDIVGNVFLVDYDEWPEKPMTEFAKFHIKPAFRTTVTESYERVVAALQGNMPSAFAKDEVSPRIRSAAGLLIARAAKGDLTQFLARVVPDVSADRRGALVAVGTEAAARLELPSAILTSNWMIDPFGLRRLYDRIIEKIEANQLKELVPVHPNAKGAGGVYARIFSRILRQINKQQGNFGGYVSTLAIPWMRGIPYPVILGRAIDRARTKFAEAELNAQMRGTVQRRRRPKPVDPSKVIRETFDIIEEVVRFEFVQLGKAYIDLLSYALRVNGKAEVVPTIYDFSLALELGISTISGRSLVELGLSRIAASALEKIYPDTNLSVDRARSWLRDVDISTLNLNPVIVDEIQRLGLARSAA